MIEYLDQITLCMEARRAVSMGAARSIFAFFHVRINPTVTTLGHSRVCSLKRKTFMQTPPVMRVLLSNDYCLQVSLWRFCVLNLYIVQKIKIISRVQKPPVGICVVDVMLGYQYKGNCRLSLSKEFLPFSVIVELLIRLPMPFAGYFERMQLMTSNHMYI